MHNSISAYLSRAKKTLSYVSDSARYDAEILLSFVLNRPSSYFYTWPDKSLSSQEAKAFDALIERRSKGEPIAYIIGIKEFWSHSLKVTRDTLIPRADTETLVESVLKLDIEQNKPLSLLELGAGSGAISIALASERPNWQITGVDISQRALEVAQENASRYGYKNIHFIQSNWFSSLLAESKFDIIVSNPPYIREDDPDLCHYVKEYEPKSALIANENGLGDIHAIIKTASTFLKADGMLALEHGYAQASEVHQLYQQYGYQNIQTLSDLSGHPRVTLGSFIV